MKGHVRKRGSKWAFVIDLGRDEVTGKRKQKWFSGYDTQKKAEKDMIAKLNELNTNTYIEPTDETVESYFLYFLDDKKDTVKPGTWRNYKGYVHNHIIPKLGKIKLQNLKPQDINRFYKELSKTISNRTVKHIHMFIKDVLEQASNWDVISKNVAKVVDPPSPKKAKIEIWEETETIRFLEIARSNRLFIAFFLALTTGMRQGEILALKWSDVDFDSKVLYVNKSLSKGEKGHELMDPKTASGKRRITLDDETLEALRQHKINQHKEKLKAGPLYKNEDFVIASTVGSFVNPRNLTRTWYQLLDSAAEQGIKKIRFHDLRHTHASYLLNNGIDIKVVSERLGHASVEITYNTYIHILPNLQETAAKKMNDIFPGFITKNAL